MVVCNINYFQYIVLKKSNIKAENFIYYYIWSLIQVLIKYSGRQLDIISHGCMHGVEPVYHTVRVINQLGKQGEKLLRVATNEIGKGMKREKWRDSSSRLLHFYNSTDGSSSIYATNHGSINDTPCSYTFHITIIFS